jgi:riboflavin kinase/FMN adenylyltransferase
MKIVTTADKIRIPKGSVAAIGIFDGVHIGHRAIIETLTRRARALGLTSVVITFRAHPSKILRPAHAPATLVSLKHRLRLIEDLGVDVTMVLNFTKEMASLEPCKFIETFLAEKIKPKEIVIGKDFHFGRHRAGDIRLLEFFGNIYGFKVRPVGTVRSLGLKVSSSRIRTLIRKGDLERASALLRRPVSVLGTVVHGTKIGSILGYPTANVNPHHEAIPPSGVYAVRVKYMGKLYGGVLNIGFRPTIDRTTEPRIEAHIFAFKKKIYGKDLEIFFVRKLRDERVFRSRDALVRQIKADEKKARLALS